jgi:hypothetical protein
MRPLRRAGRRQCRLKTSSKPSRTDRGRPQRPARPLAVHRQRQRLRSHSCDSDVVGVAPRLVGIDGHRTRSPWEGRYFNRD